jgi:hypothetical protein
MGWRTEHRPACRVYVGADLSVSLGPRRQRLGSIHPGKTCLVKLVWQKTPPARVARTRFLVVLILVCYGGVTLVRGQSNPTSEYQVKAAFLYNFAKFVEWPPSSFSGAPAPLRICILGQDPFGQELRSITNEKMVNGRKLEVSQVADLQQARSCHILFIASSERTSMKQILEGLRGAGVLTVADTKGFTDQGGMINFVLENDRVQFEVNRKTAEQAGLKISSKLLSIAKSVIV